MVPDELTTMGRVIKETCLLTLGACIILSFPVLVLWCGCKRSPLVQVSQQCTDTIRWQCEDDERRGKPG